MDTLIIGGGLSGLALAEKLEAARHDYVLVEGRNRFGGRIKTEFHQEAAFDMGPAWFWPGQPRISALIDRLGLEAFEQYAKGDATFEDERGRITRSHGFAAMEASFRLKGGLTALIDALVRKLPKARAHKSASVVSLNKSGTKITATLTGGETLTANRVVLALPPRMAANITFWPPLPDTALQAMQAVPTWMAGHTKALAVYDSPFWRVAGLSGDATSRLGPMVEIHDASPSTGSPYALFGFIGIPPENRSDPGVLRSHILSQFERLFGDAAGSPSKLFVKDWAFDAYTATPADHLPLHAHPSYGMPLALNDLWHNDLLMSGTEVAPRFGGFLEGALEAAELTALTINGLSAGRYHAE